MVKHLEHIGIAVSDMEKAIELYSRLLGTRPYKEETVETEGVRTVFFRIGEVKIELLEGVGPDNPIDRFVAKRGAGIHHLAYEVEDIFEAIRHCKEQGFQLVNEEPRVGADNKLICFIHPKSADGVLIELCQSIQ